MVKKSLSNFYLAGVSYEKTNTKTRGLFAVDDAVYGQLKESSPEVAGSEIFILSTCNRTEIYGFAENAGQLADVLCKKTESSAQNFLEYAYTLSGEEAVTHLYRVACGLNSQILGDFDVSAQIKRFSKKAREARMLGAFTERLISNTLKASKRVKNETGLSSGTTSVSFAVVRYLQQIPNIIHKNILLLGIGKIGRNTCKNLRTYLGIKNVTLVNRTLSKARNFAEENGFAYASLEELPAQLEKADIILVATNSPSPTLLKKDISKRNKMILDLSVPNNVERGIREIPGVKVIDVDELSQIKDQTLEVRKKEIPSALSIIEQQKTEFLEWYEMRRHASILKDVKKKMTGIFDKVIREQYPESDAAELKQVSKMITQKMLNVFAGKLKNTTDKADFFYRVLGELFGLPAEDIHEEND